MTDLAAYYTALLFFGVVFFVVTQGRLQISLRKINERHRANMTKINLEYVPHRRSYEHSYLSLTRSYATAGLTVPFLIVTMGDLEDREPGTVTFKDITHAVLPGYVAVTACDQDVPVDNISTSRYVDLFLRDDEVRPLTCLACIGLSN